MCGELQAIKRGSMAPARSGCNSLNTPSPLCRHVLLVHAPYTQGAPQGCSMPIVTSVFLTGKHVPMQDRSHTLKSFAAYADWAKALHFSDPPPGASSPLPAQPPKRRKISSYTGPEPTVEEIEAEFWRIVEVADEVSAGSLLCNPCLNRQLGVPALPGACCPPERGQVL